MGSPFETTMKIGGLLISILMIYLIIAGGVTLAYYYRLGQGEKDGMWYSERQKWIPKKWIAWAGYPSTFSNISGVNVTSKTLLKKVKASSAKTCMLSCDAENSRKTTKCIGFLFDKTQCYLASSMNGIIENTSTSNVLYLVDGTASDDVKQFYEYAGKGPGTAGYSVVSSSSLDKCASNCVSNVECNGFTFASGSCGLYSNMNDTTFGTVPGVNSYPLKDHAELTSVSDVIYWKS